MDSKPDLRAQLKVMLMIHGALALVLIVFGTFVLWLNETDPAGELTGENQVLRYVPPLLLLVAFPLSRYLFRNQIDQVDLDSMDLHRKMGLFQTAHLVRMAVFDVAGLMAVVVSFVTAENYNLGVLAAVLLMFLLLKPSPSRLAIDLHLSPEETDALRNTRN